MILKNLSFFTSIVSERWLTVALEIKKIASLEHNLISLSALIIRWTLEIGNNETPGSNWCVLTAFLTCAGPATALPLLVGAAAEVEAILIQSLKEE